MMGLNQKNIFFITVSFGAAPWLLLRWIPFKADCDKLLILLTLGKSKIIIILHTLGKSRL